METDCRFASLKTVKDDVYAGGATDMSTLCVWGSGSRKDTQFKKVFRDCLKIEKVSKVQRAAS